MIKKPWTDVNPITVPSPMGFDQLAHTWFCYFYVLSSELMPRENIIPLKSFEKNVIQWVLIEHLVCAQHWHQALGWTKQNAKCGGGRGALAALTHCWWKPNKEGLQLHPGLSVKLWHVQGHLSTTHQTGTRISQKPGPYIEDDAVIIAERDFRNSSSTIFSF